MAFGYVNERWKQQHSYVEFMTVLENGHELNTNNSKILATVAVASNKTVLRIRTRDLAALHRFHSASVHYAGRLRKKVDHSGKDWTDELRQGTDKWIDRMIRKGYLRYETESGRYRYTWKGAFISVWSLLPPLGSLAAWRNGGRTKALLRWLGPAHV